ncbi:MAG: acyltransferase [Bacillaceae bacterium]
MLEHPIAHKRVPELTILKAMAFLSVVIQSSFVLLMKESSPSIEQSIIIGMFFNLVKFSAPAFIFLAGFSIVQQYYKHFVYRDYLFHKTKEIIFPYILWTIVYIICLQPSLFISGSFSEIGLTFLTGTAAPHLWYVIMVFQFHLLTPLIFLCIPFIKKWIESKKSLYIFVISIAAIYTLLMWISHRYLATSESLLLQMTDRIFLAYSFYFIVGGIAALTLHKWRRFVIKVIPICLLLYICLFGRVSYELLQFGGIWDIELQISTYLKPSMFFYILIELILLYGLAMLIAKTKSYLRTILNFVGQHCYNAYLAHIFFLYMITNMVKPEGTVLNGLLLFAISATMSIAFSFLISTFRLKQLFNNNQIYAHLSNKKVILPLKQTYQVTKKFESNKSSH